MSEKAFVSHPGVAAVLSFIFTGLGQFYNGQIKKGLFLVALVTVGLVFLLLGALGLAFILLYGSFQKAALVVSVFLLFCGGIIVCWAGVYSIFDAHKNAS